MNQLAKDFKQWLMEEGRSSKTIESYLGDVQGFQKYMAEKAANETKLLSRFAFVRYKQHLEEQSFEVSTVNKKVNSLKVYNDFLRMKGLVQENFNQLKIDKILIASGSEHVVTALSEEDVERLLFYLENHTKVSL